MPQELHVVRCYSCQTFQVQIVKKINKWECKMCGEKQSLKKVYGKGSGKDCRLLVQRLNEMTIKEQDTDIKYVNQPQLHENEDLTSEVCNIERTSNDNNKSNMSKWSKFLDENGDDDSDESNPQLATQTNNARLQYEENEKEDYNDWNISCYMPLSDQFNAADTTRGSNNYSLDIPIENYLNENHSPVPKKPRFTRLRHEERVTQSSSSDKRNSLSSSLSSNENGTVFSKNASNCSQGIPKWFSNQRNSTQFKNSSSSEFVENSNNLQSEDHSSYENHLKHNIDAGPKFYSKSSSKNISSEVLEKKNRISTESNQQNLNDNCNSSSKLPSFSSASTLLKSKLIGRDDYNEEDLDRILNF